MTDKELKRLSRPELLEMLIAQMEENKTLQEQLETAQAQLQDRRILIDNAGSIAEAALQVSGVFDAAQTAAQEYLDNIQRLYGEQDSICQRIVAEAQQKADSILSEADAYSQRTHAEADDYRNQVIQWAHTLIQDHNNLRALIESVERDRFI